MMEMEFLGTQQFQFHHQIAKKMTKKFQKFVYEVGPGEIGFSRLDILDPPNISFHPIGVVFVVQNFLFNPFVASCVF